MATLAINPSDARRAARAPSPRALGTGLGWSTIAVGLGVTVGMAGLAEIWTGAVSDFLATSRAERSEIRIGPVADMPEIKNGVVAIGSAAAPVRVVPGSPTAIAAAPRPLDMKPILDPKPITDAKAAVPAKPAPDPKVVADAKAPAVTAPVVAATPARPAPVAQTRPTATGSIATAPVAAASAPAARPVVATASMPLPPIAQRPSLTTLQAAPLAAPAPAPAKASALAAISPLAPLPPVRAALRKPDAAAPPQKIAARNVPPAAGSTAPATPEERSLLGIPVPGFVPSGNDIKSGFDSIGDAVMNLPKRF